MRYERSRREWSIITPMLPTKPRGIPRVDDRRGFNGIFWVCVQVRARGAICQRANSSTRLATIVWSRPPPFETIRRSDGR